MKLENAIKYCKKIEDNQDKFDYIGVDKFIQVARCLLNELANVNMDNLKLIAKDNYWKTNAVPNEIINISYVSKDRIREKLETCQKTYEKEMKPYQREYGLDVTYLSKKEKNELINKRNCLLVQMETYKQLLEEK